MRTSVQKRIGGYDPALPHSGDIEMWMRAAAVSDVGHIRGADQAYYRRHGANMSAVDFGGQLDDLRQRRAAFESVLVKCGDALPAAEAWAAEMRRKLARQALRRAVRAYDKGLTGTVPVDGTGHLRGGLLAATTGACRSTRACACGAQSASARCHTCGHWW